MDLSQVRVRIDEIDRELMRLFCERMDIAADVAAAKRETGKAVFDPARERQKLATVAGMVPQARRPQALALMNLLMSMSKAEQLALLKRGADSSTLARARASLLSAETPFPEVATVACQGVEGAYSQLAACRLFKVPSISYAPDFAGVIRAVSEGACEFGVLPIENSTAGSVNAVYDLLAESGLAIVRSCRLKVEHNLMARPGCSLAGIREVVSHEQALAQCAGYLERLGVSTRVCENTARAARIVSESGRDDLAALSSRSCAGLYGLDILGEAVQDSDSNYTRFVVVCAEPRIYPGATRTSLMVTLRHEPGSLYRVLERIYALDVNLVKLESRPIPGRDFQFAFYFDVECAVGSPAFGPLLDALDDVCETVTYFGSYQEVL